ncbi:MAG: dipeptide epimerase [Gemmatimonadaceae bacterium]|nr:dipeptide epimerase [Gemmatimonadaceae bacterium]
MKVHAEILTLDTKHPFVIARGGSQRYRTVFIRLVDDDGVEGWGEAAATPYYGETAETVLAVIERVRPILEQANPWHIEATEAAISRSIGRNPAAKVAISMALHDLMGKRVGQPLYKLWGLDPAASPKSSFTIAIPASLDELRSRVHEAIDAGYPVLKVKLGSDRDEALIRTVRETAPNALLRVDANCAWTPRHAVSMIPLLEGLGVEFVEQPLEPWDLDGLKFVREHSSLPIVADESCLVASDVAKLAGIVDGINLKLAKCGSLGEARKIVTVARAHGMLVMAGCMIESSVAITAAAHLAPLLDYVDLDGAALLAQDPFVGATITGGVVTLPSGPGLGLSRR